ncbi:MAG: UDP-N-acetylmuramate dehydrogenase [Bacteroidia bacterium]|nr:UDP-N-acetylmuramate dehydrogenase [Bacteroidia bacterium]
MAMKILHNVSLLPFNTFKMNVKAKECRIIEDENELLKIDTLSQNSLVLGGGSNVLFTKDYDGIILKNELKGREIIDESEEEILLNIKGGENWHSVVMWAVENNWNGIENLALIPGTMGAAPIQNIGAYGVEIKDVLEYVRFYHFDTKSFETIKNQDCQFAYRDSIFKRSLKNKVFITDVGLRLRKKNHQYKLDYGNIREELDKRNIQTIRPKLIAEVVMHIRQTKLPDPNVVGNAGSFFKNPEVSEEVYWRLKEKFPNIVAYSIGNNKYKLAAGWMIEYCGFKGYVHKGAAVHTRQALVLINQKNATGKDILELANIIIDKVNQVFGVILEPEVNIIG